VRVKGVDLWSELGYQGAISNAAIRPSLRVSVPFPWLKAAHLGDMVTVEQQ